MKEYERMDKIGMKKENLIGQKLIIDEIGDSFLVKDRNDKPINVRSVYMTLIDEDGTELYVSMLVGKGSALDRKNLEGAKYLTLGTQDTGKQSPMYVWEAFEE